MRVIAGELKGRRLVAPRGWKVRPTSDRVREAIFSALGDVVRRPRARPLLRHRGARRSRRFRAARQRPSSSTATPAPALGERRATRPRRARRAGPLRRRALAAGPAGALDASPFDLVFVDAPYRLADRVGQELNTHLPRLLTEGGRAIVESGARRPLRIDSLERAPSAPLRRRRRLLLRRQGAA